MVMWKQELLGVKKDMVMIGGWIEKEKMGDEKG